MDELYEIKTRHPGIGGVKVMGLMFNIEFIKNYQRRDPDDELWERIIHQACEGGLLILGCGISAIRIAPQLNSSRTEIEERLKIFAEVIALTARKQYITYVT